MATKYLSENDLPFLEQRIASVFAEKPIVARFIIETTDWASDSSTGKYKCSVGINSDFNANTMGDVAIDLGSISSVANRIAIEDATVKADVRMLNITTETVSGETIGVIEFFAKKIPTIDIPIILTIIGTMPS